MNKYFKIFLHRGLIFGGFGPIIIGVVYCAVERGVNNFSLTAGEILLAIVSSYILAFLQAGASVFNQIEHWGISKSILCHFLTLYIAYSVCYIVNSWIPFIPSVLLVFTLIFVVLYFVIWTTVYLCVRASAKKLNSRL